MKKIIPQTTDITQQNINQIAQLFPQVITEKEDENGNTVKAIDFELLKQHLSDAIVEGSDERYRLDWPGKRASILKANTPITSTLKPDRESSVNFDTTENVYIEGDNFEVLKVLQESYLGKVKMIYIDPPYNTGKDFVYKDNFKVSKDDYEEELGTEDEEGGKLFKNTDTNGRFHSDWLSMMYERLLVARDLLKEDGVIFMSIDDNEVHNLRKIADEVFGEENFESEIAWRRRHNQPNDKSKMVAKVSESIIVFAKNSQYLKKKKTYYGLPLSKKRISEYTNPDNDPKGGWSSNPWKAAVGRGGSTYKLITKTGKVFNETWYGNLETFESYVKDNRVHWTDNGNGYPRIKIYLDEAQRSGQAGINFFTHEEFGSNQLGSGELRNLMNEDGLFDNPKPTKLLKSLIKLATTKDDLILDFFSGSASIGDSVFQLNFEESTNRKFILVQLQEETDEKSEAYKAGYKTIPEIGKERIRRAGKKILEENAEQLKERKTPLDVGFRVYKTSPSILKEVAKHPSQITQANLFASQDNIKEDASPEDILTSVILDFGLTLDHKITTQQIAGSTIFIVDDNALVACFDTAIDMHVVDTMAKIQPIRAVFRDACFKDDKDLINTVESRFKQIAPNTKVHVI